MNYVKKLFNDIKIYKNNFNKIRVGSEGDGGYVLLDKINKNTNTVLSFGIEDNIDFEIDFLNKYPGTKFFMYDHTVNKLPKKNKNFYFYNKGLSDKKSKKFTTLEEISNKITTNTLLKIDIEWDEWKIFDSVNPKILDNFSQIVIEFHFASLSVEDINSQNNLTPYFHSFYSSIYEKINLDLFRKYKNVLDMINKKFYIFHLSINNSLPLKMYKKYAYPILLETSFVRKDLFTNPMLSKEKYPIKNLDFPNKSYKKDFNNFYPFRNLSK